MSSIHIPPIPSIKMVTQEGFPTPEMAMWNQQLLQSRSGWTAYTPTTGNVSAITSNDCAYVQLGKLTAFRILIQGTTNGTALTVTLPFKAKSGGQTFAVFISPLAGVSSIGGDLQTLTVAKYDGTTFVNGSVVLWVISGVYEAQ